jgi:hypothetical protein
MSDIENSGADEDPVAVTKKLSENGVAALKEKAANKASDDLDGHDKVNGAPSPGGKLTGNDLLNSHDKVSILRASISGRKKFSDKFSWTKGHPEATTYKLLYQNCGEKFY